MAVLQNLIDLFISIFPKSELSIQIIETPRVALYVLGMCVLALHEPNESYMFVCIVRKKLVSSVL